MKLHDLHPAEGSRKKRMRVGRGIAAGKGKTAGRGTKGQKARTGGTIQPWFEGGQTPIHVRVPKLRGFRNPFRIEYEVVNIGRINDLAETGILDAPELAAAADTAKVPAKAGKPIPVTITPDILAAVGLVRTLDKPLKVLGHGDVTRALFVVADAFSKSAVAKIEAAGGTAHVLEFPSDAGSDEPLESDSDAESTVESDAPAAPKAPKTASAEKPAAETAKADKPAAKAQADKPAAKAQADKPAAKAARPAKADKPASDAAKDA
jgi:large subunit ribosomal protein L15